MLQSERTQSMKSLQDSMGQLMQENSELKRKLSRLLKRVSVNPFDRTSAKPQVHSQLPHPPFLLRSAHADLIRENRERYMRVHARPFNRLRSHSECRGDSTG